MTISHGLDPERTKGAGRALQSLGDRVGEIHETGVAMIRVLEDVWAGADLEGFAQDWSAVAPTMHAAADHMRGAGAELIRQADDQIEASIGIRGPGTRTPDGEYEYTWWDVAKGIGHSIVDEAEDVVDTVTDGIRDGVKDVGRLVGEGLDWLNERWKDFVETDFMEVIVDFIEDVGEWFDNLPWWGKAIIGTVIGIAAVAAIIFAGAPVLATLAVAATIFTTLMALNEFAEFLRDPKKFLGDWWENSSTVEKVITIGSIILAPLGGRIIGPLLRRLDGPLEDAAHWVRRKIAGDKDPVPYVKAPPRRHDYVDEDGNPVRSRYADDQVDESYSTRNRLDDLLTKHGMTRREFDRALLEEVPDDAQDLSADQVKLKAIRDELGAPRAGERMQKVLTPDAYQNHMDGTFKDTIQGSVTRLDDGAQMRTPRELHDGLRLDYDAAHPTFSPNDQEVKVMRFTAKSDADVSRYSSMGGDGSKDGWGHPYTGNGFTKSTDPVVPESSLPSRSTLDDGAEIWTVRADGTQELDAVLVNRKWVKVV
ncbi:WXG100 family type VII secretion target [Janibacter anophelis]|uniref:WXG100 family type VII secretion target n=1 Tax=Janibacter anophelis TaxID=319054 RepID=UPI0013B053E4|nr:hypothetical protein [Janibacter anophelis]